MLTVETEEIASNANDGRVEQTDSTASSQVGIASQRERLLAAINSTCLTTLEERVAWLLNNYPNTRDSDVTLQIRYWQRFQPHDFDGGAIGVRNYYRLAKLTSIARARATIQNKLKLFQATTEVKKRRKQLQGDEHANATKRRSNYHRYAIYLDESGKNENNLVVGSMWYLDGSETMKTYNLVKEWRKTQGFEGELHFKSISEAKLPLYCSLADLIATNGSAISFKTISVARSGIPNLRDAILKLAYHLVIRGIEHEHTTGRAPLPRAVLVCKDAEEPGYDKLFIAELADRLKQSSVNQFHGDLYVDECSAEDSASNIHLQLVDLFTSSVHRKMNATGERKNWKDIFADYFLNKLGISIDAQRSESFGDMTFHITL